MPGRALILIAATFTAVPLVAGDATATAWQRFHARSTETLNALAHTTLSTDLDRTAPAVELSYESFFSPIGDEGLSYTDTLKSLAGKRVRVTGFMVREARRHRGIFVLVQRANVVQADGTCVSLDLPPATVYAHLPAPFAATLVPYVPGQISVTGTLEIGMRPEVDGRNSAVRLRLDYAPSFIQANGAPPATPVKP